MNENLIPECREFTMIEELWPIKRYEGNRLIWDCRQWLIEAIQDEILTHVKQYNHPYVLTLSEELIWTKVAYENRQDTSHTVGMQKLSPLEISMIVTPFLRKSYNIYQDEKSKCIKISRKQIPGLKPLELPQDLMRVEWEKSRLDEIWAKEEAEAVRYMMELIRYNGFTAIKRNDSTDTSLKFIIYLETGAGRATIDAEIRIIGKDQDPHLFYQSVIGASKEIAEMAGYTDRTSESAGYRTAHEAAVWIARAVTNINRQLLINGKKNRDNNDR